MSEFEAGREVGEQAATIESLDKRLTTLEKKVDQVLERVTLARGGIAVLIAIGSCCAAITEAVLLWLHGKGP